MTLTIDLTDVELSAVFEALTCLRIDQAQKAKDRPEQAEAFIAFAQAAMRASAKINRAYKFS
jgi:hypothetical protein